MSTFSEMLRQAKADIDEIDTSQAAEFLDKGWLLIDVREPSEYQLGAIPGSLNFPRGILEANVEGKIPDRNTRIMTVCNSGGRSALAAATLQELGYTRVVSVNGGFQQWRDEGRSCHKPRILTSDQCNRYARHLTLPEIGEDGQAKLLDAEVLLFGAGGLGSPAALYLAAAGVGRLGIIDMGSIDLSNLQRQVIHSHYDVGERKVDSAEKVVTGLNPDVDVVTYDIRLQADNVVDIVSGYDVIVDGCNNLEGHYLLDDASVKLGVPVVHGSVRRFEGQVTVFDPRKGPTFRDVMSISSQNAQNDDYSKVCVLGVLPGIVGTLQTLEALKLILGIGDPLVGRLLVFDALTATFSEFELLAENRNDIE